jgi:hypothetical protein
MAPTPSTFATELAALLPVIVGGAIALISGIAGAIANHMFATKRDEAASKRQAAAAKRERLERIVTAVHDLATWLKKNDNYYFFGQGEVLEQSPMATVMTYTSLYFPSMKPEAAALEKAVMTYIQWLIAGARLRLAANPQVVPQAHIDQLPAIWGPFQDARDAMLAKAEAQMTTL